MEKEEKEEKEEENFQVEWFPLRNPNPKLFKSLVLFTHNSLGYF